MDLNSDLNLDLNVVDPLFIFFITLGGNFVAQLFPCQVQKVFTENIYYKHFLAFFILFFAIVLNNKSELTNRVFFKAITLYCIFIALTRMDKNFLLLFFVILCIKIIVINKMTHTHDASLKKKYERIDHILGYMLMCNGIVGVALYYGQKRFEYGDRFNSFTFLLGKPSCSKRTIPTNYARSLAHILK